MVYPVARPTSRRVRMGTVLGTIFLLWIAAPDLARGQAHGVPAIGRMDQAASGVVLILAGLYLGSYYLAAGM